MEAFETRKCVEVEEVLGQELKQMSRYSINGEPAPAWCVFLHMHHCKLICEASHLLSKYKIYFQTIPIFTEHLLNPKYYKINGSIVK